MYVPDINCFFVHIPKTGGVSIELAFFNRDNLNIKQHNIVRQLNKSQKIKYRYGNYKENIVIAQHFTATEAKKYIPEFDDCYTFAVVRNPWDRFISELCWQQQTLKRNINIHALIEQCENETKKDRNGNCHLIPQWLYVYDDNGNQLVDDIFKLENMVNNIKIINTKLNINIKINKSNSTNRKHYQFYFSQELKQRVNNLYYKDIDLFDYKY